MRKIILFLFVLFILFVSNIFSDEEYDNFAELNKVETIHKINEGYYWIWFKNERIEIQYKIAELCGFLDVEQIHDSQQHVADCLDVMKELKYHYKKITGNDFPEVKRTDEYYMIYEIKKDNTGYDLEVFKNISKEDFDATIERRKETIEYFTNWLNKLLKASKIGGVIDKVKAYDRASAIVNAEKAIKNLTFYYEYFNKKKD